MPRFHNINGKRVQFTEEEELAQDAFEAEQKPIIRAEARKQRRLFKIRQVLRQQEVDTMEELVLLMFKLIEDQAFREAAKKQFAQARVEADAESDAAEAAEDNV